MGVRILVGEYDGTEQMAVMVDSVIGTAFGPLFENADDIESFCAWLRGEPFRLSAGQMGLTPADVPVTTAGSDPRAWPESGLKKLVSYWTKNVKTAEPAVEA